MSLDPIQRFARLYTVASLSRSRRGRRQLPDSYDVCFTSSGDLIRITSITAVNFSHRFPTTSHNRVYREREPRVWETVRQTLLEGSRIYYETDALGNVRRNHNPFVTAS